MQEVLSILEHQKIPIVTKRSLGEVALEERHLQILNKMNTLPKGAYTWGHQSIKWSQFCGLVQLSEITLEILPKTHNEESPLEGSRNVLIKMLQNAGILKLYRLGRAGLGTNKHKLLDVFILDFCQQLNRQLIQGKLREYKTEENNLSVIRGKLLINQQLRCNSSHKERLYCQYDELSENIYLNQLIRLALSLILPQVKSQRLKVEVVKLLNIFDNVDDISVNPKEIQVPDLKRSDLRFNDVLELSVIFIKTLSPNINAGKLESFALMFDMNKLFESWVASQLKPVAIKNGLILREQGPRRYLAYREDIGKNVFQMKPDICLLDKDNKVVLIADAKWKVLDKQEIKLGISQTDMYQVHTYATEYSTNHSCLIYPNQEKELSRTNFSFLSHSNLAVFMVDIESPTNFGEIIEFTKSNK